MSWLIVGIIPPRPSARVGTLVLEDGAPIKSITVKKTWMQSTKAEIGGRIEFEPFLRYLPVRDEV